MSISDNKHPTLLSISETAALFSVSENTIRRLIVRGEIPAVRVGDAYRIDRAKALAAAEAKARRILGKR